MKKEIKTKALSLDAVCAVRRVCYTLGDIKIKAIPMIGKNLLYSSIKMYTTSPMNKTKKDELKKVFGNIIFSKTEQEGELFTTYMSLKVN